MRRMPKRILVADDVESLRKAVARFLAQEGFETLLAADGSDALLIASESHPDLIVVDAMMPGLTGHEVCRILKKKKETRSIPIIIMSGEMIEEKDVVSGLEGGADDYLAKPFTMKVLLARIRAVLRRYDHEEESLTIQKRCGIALDPEGRTVKVSGQAVELARKEFDLLALLLSGRDGCSSRLPPRGGLGLRPRRLQRPAHRRDPHLPPAQETRPFPGQAHRQRAGDRLPLRRLRRGYFVPEATQALQGKVGRPSLRKAAAAWRTFSWIPFCWAGSALAKGPAMGAATSVNMVQYSSGLS